MQMPSTETHELAEPVSSAGERTKRLFGQMSIEVQREMIKISNAMKFDQTLTQKQRGKMKLWLKAAFVQEAKRGRGERGVLASCRMLGESAGRKDWENKSSLYFDSEGKICEGEKIKKE